jgi:hypothetical protein
MWKIALIFGSSVLTCLLILGAYPTSSGALSRALGLQTADQSLLVKIKKNKNSGNIWEGNNHCGAGETDLETPNKYKACCEPAGGFQTAPKAPTEAKECGFGMIGTPPNHCDCPAGTEFKGFKGCVKKVVQGVGWLCEADVKPTGHHSYAM